MASGTEGQRVTACQSPVSLKIFRINLQNLLQDFDCIGILTLEKQDSSQIVQRYPVARILRQHDLQVVRGLIVIADILHQGAVKEIRAGQFRVDG